MGLLLSAILFLAASFPAAAQFVSLAIQTGHSVSINRLRFSPDGRLAASAGADGRILVWDVSAGRQLITLTGHRESVNDISFGPDNTLASASDDGRVIIWHIDDGTKAKEYSWHNPVKSVVYSSDGQKLVVSGKTVSIVDISSGTVKDLAFTAKYYYSSISISNDMKYAAFGGEKEKRVTVIDIGSGQVTKQFKAKANEVAFSKDGAYLVAAGNNGSLKRFYLKGGSKGRQVVTAERIWHSYMSAAISDQYYAAGNKNNLIAVYDLQSSRKLKVLNGHRNDVMALAFSPDQKVLASSGVDRDIILWNTSDWEIDKIIKGTVEKVNAIEFTDNGEELVVGYSDGSFRFWDTEPGGDITSNKLQTSAWKERWNWEYTVTDAKDVKDNRVDLQVYKVKRYKKQPGFKKIKSYTARWDIEKNKVTLKGGRKTTNVNLDDIFVKENLSDKHGDLTIVASNTKDLTRELKITRPGGSSSINTNHSDDITAVKINPHKGLIATASSDGLIKFWDLKTGSPLVSLIASGTNDCLFITPDNYYYSTKGALEHIGFKIGSQIFSFEQFDVKYNRPDLVLEKLNHPDTAMRTAYRLAHAKRLQKSEPAIDENSIKETPQVTLNSPVAGLSTKERHYPLVIDAKSNDSPVKKLYVTVNGVPLYKEGIDVGKYAYHNELRVELNTGVNKIQCYAVNEKGISSLQQSLQVRYKGNIKKPDLYLVTIGASTYKDAAFNLRYAAKDAQDIDKLFASSARFEQVKKVSLLNENVTSENIMKLKEFLAPAQVDDLVLISYSGHGLLDRDLDYFLSTYETDFADVENGGLPYSKLEGLLEETKSRNKVLILDACHSGEIDKDEMELQASAQTSDGTISFRSVGSGAKRKGNSNLKTSFEMSKVLFADTKTTHGAVVISSAAGGEYAIEGKDWNNGIFTYCFINGLKKMKADLNQDGKVTIAELQRFVNKEVPKVSGGRQTPTSRDENVNNDFVIWED